MGDLENQNPPEPTVDSGKVKPEDKAPKKEEKVVKPEEQVEVRVNDSWTCYIAGKQYDFEKGKTKKVPKSVKEILLGAGKLEAV